MLPADIISVCERKPFQPFLMHLADGREIPVLHREFIMAWPEGQTVIVGQPDGKYNLIDLLLVTDIEPIVPEKKRAGNGKR